MMSSLQDPARKTDASPENQCITSLTHIQIKLPEATDYFTRVPSFRKMQEYSSARLLQQICIVLLYLIISVALICVAVPVAATGFSLGLASLVIAPILALPMLLLSLLVTRLLQIGKHEDGYDLTTQLKLLIRTWIFLDLGLVLFGMGILFVVATSVTALKHVILIGLPLTSWVKIACMICGMCCLSYALTALTYVLLRFLLGSGFGVPEAFAEVIDCLLIWWGESEVMNRVPQIRHHKILGLHTRKWIAVTVFVIIGYNIITLFNHMILWSLRRFISPKLDPGADKNSTRNLVVEKILCRNYMVFCANWLRSSITFILTSLLLVLTWVFYFGSHLTKSDRSREVLDFGKWTFVSLLIFSFLWLIKTFTLLIWEAHAIYSRLSCKILEAGKQLYFLGIISRHTEDILGLNHKTTVRTKVDGEKVGKREDHREKDQRKSHFGLLYAMLRMLKQSISSNFHRITQWESEDEQEDERVDQPCTKKLSSKKKRKIKHDLLLKNQNATLFDIEQVGRYLLAAKNALSNELNIHPIIESLERIDLRDGNGSVKENLKQLIDRVPTEEDNKKKGPENSDFEELLTSVHFSEEITSEEFERWMERSRNNCVLLANTIGSAKEVADVLNNLTSGFLVGATFIMWLLLTGLATTKVLVLIASPLLAATVIFGDTCKNLFQGIIFVFLVHPFDVGDLCVIDNQLMEVKAIGVWTATFTKVDKVGTQDKVIYPNSELASKVITNHKTKFDCNDFVEFNVDSVNDEQIPKLKSQIEDYLKGEDARFTSNPHNVMCLRKKDQQRSDFILYVLKRMKNRGISEKIEEETRTEDVAPAERRKSSGGKGADKQDTLSD